MKKGVAISPGIAIARAYRIDEVLARRDPASLDSSGVVAELTRLDAAVAAVAADLDRVIERVLHDAGEDAAEIFRAHRLLLRDPAMVGKVKTIITTRQVDARSALQDALDEYTTLFARIPDEYLRERMADIRDVVGRLVSHLTRQEQPKPLESDEPVILVSPEILPSQTVMFERLVVSGILTETGGSTGHAAILARSLGIPAVSGLRGIMQEVHTGDLVILDGRDGHVLVNPGPEVESAYRKVQREYVDLRDRLIENRDQPAQTADGVSVELLANVNNLADAQAAERVGAIGVGLYRTEYLFLTHAAIPTEDEQASAYRQVIEASPNRRITIRTLDLGGDKQVPYLGTHREANPFMGWRSIRLISAYPELFQGQLRAILRASTAGKVSVLFPMISTVEEVRRLKQMFDRTKLNLTRAGVPIGEDVTLGVMIEVPAAALVIDHILDEVDFVSIGSNDLTQYVMAADRDNPKVAHLCEPFAPSVMRLLRQVIRTCVEREKPVTLCGEMAGRPRCWLPLFGFGLRRLSMSPGFIPAIKEVTRAMTSADANAAAEQILHFRTATEVRNFLTARVKQICPNVALLDTQK